MGIENMFEKKEHPTCPRGKGALSVTNGNGEKETCSACCGSGKVK